MKYTTIASKLSETDEKNIGKYDLEYYFNVNVDKNGNYTFNLNNTVYIKINPNDLELFTIKYETCNWPLISYKLYGTTRLTWLLFKLNNINAENVFMVLQPGMKIRCISKGLATKLLNNMDVYS